MLHHSHSILAGEAHFTPLRHRKSVAPLLLSLRQYDWRGEEKAR